MFVLLAAGVVARVWHASGTYLHPDEALHFYVANKTSYFLTYRAGLTLLHPPLLVFLLHVWRGVGTSELMLRTPSIIASMAFCWLTFRWLMLILSEAVAWISFIFVLFLPSSIALGSEIRQYALLLAFAMACAYFLELALARNSARLMFLSAVSLWLAISSHYSAFLFAAVLCAYAISRIARHQPDLKVIAMWEGGQIVAFGLCYFFYVTHIAILGQKYSAASAAQGWMGNTYLSNSYYVPGKINPLLFAFARTGGVFQYVFNQAIIGDIAFLLFLIAVTLLLRRRVSTSVTRFQMGLLLIGPFALNCAAALLRLYPYGGTRHSAFLIPFAIAGVSVTIAASTKERVFPGMLAALAIALVCNVFSSHHETNMSREGQRADHMKAAVDFIQRQAPVSEPVFADYQTSLMLNHYLCRQQPVTMNLIVRGFVTYDCGGHRVIATDWNTDIFTEQNFKPQVSLLVSKFKLQSGSQLWVAQIGPPGTFVTDLARTGAFSFAPHDFGAYIHFFELPVGNIQPTRPRS